MKWMIRSWARSFPLCHTLGSRRSLFDSTSSHLFLPLRLLHPWPTLVSTRFFSFLVLTLSIFSFPSGFFKGTSADQDRRFSDKELKLLKTLKFPPQFDTKVCYSSSSFLPTCTLRPPPPGRHAQGQLAGHSTLGRQKSRRARRFRGRSSCRVRHGPPRGLVPAGEFISLDIFPHLHPY